MKTERDGYGRPVPRRLAEVFAGRRGLALWSRELQALRDRLFALKGQPFCREVDFDRIGRHLDAVRTLLNLQAPLEPCNCDVDKRDCPRCKGSRWVTAAAGLSQEEVAP